MGRLPTVCGKPFVALALVAALAACSSPSATSTPTPDAGTEPQAGISPRAPASQTDHGVEIAKRWESLHDERIRQTYTDEEPDGSPFERFATDDTVGLLVDHVRAARSDVPTQLVDVEYWTEIDISPTGDSADIADCIIVAERPTGQADAEPTVRSQVWTGTVIESDGGWVVDDISIGIDNCVPRELNDQLLDAYREWHEAKQAWWDPPDPTHPLLEDRMVDPGLSDMRDLLDEHRRQGIVVRDEHDLANAVVFELGIGTARISDCFSANPDNIAAYDQESGERREDLSPSPTPGQVDHTILDLERSADGRWVANGWRSTTGSDCTPGGTPYAVAP